MSESKEAYQTQRQVALEHLLTVAREIVAKYGDACGTRQYDYIRLDLHWAVMGVNAVEGRSAAKAEGRVTA